MTAGAPLREGDGWRIWYSWQGQSITPSDPSVRKVGGGQVKVVGGGWEPELTVAGSQRRMRVRNVRLDDHDPGSLYEVTIPERGETVTWRTLPQQVPDEGMALLMASCFWLDDDADGFYAAAVRDLVGRERPVFKLLMGDQLYVDVWPPSPKRLRENLATKYERYWGDAKYQEVLAACPNLVSSDDHEFWNDFPEPQMHIPYSWDRHSPENTEATLELFDAYQAALNPGGSRWCDFSVSPVSFFVADTRSERSRSSDPDASFMLEAQWRALEAWAKRLKGPGVLVLSQPLFKSGGSRTDRTLIDFTGNAARLGAVFERALGGDEPHDILILTGDIHTGRLSTATIVGVPGEVNEFVASPAALVTPWLPPWGHKPSKLPDRLQIGRSKWEVRSHRRLTSTVDNNIGLVRIAPGTNGRTRITLQLWRVRRFTRLDALRRRAGIQIAKVPAHPIHDPIELQLR